MVGVDELIDQPGFPNASFSYCCHELTMASSCTLQELMQGCQLRVAADKPRQASRHVGLEATAD
jgi:hypothetical protein